jgi:uncharacterized membrane protein
MNLAPLFSAPFAVQVHVYAAVGAALIALVQFVGRKGATTHRVLGWTWAGLMLLTAVSSIFIVDVANLRPTALILILSALVMVQVPLAVRAARRHAVVEHRSRMTWLTVGALLIAGGFTLLPGRLMHAVIFG